MRLWKGLLILPLVLAFAAAGCESGNNSLAQDDGAAEPGPETSMSQTSFTGKVIAQGNTSCGNGIAGFALGDTVDVVMSPTTGKAGVATVSVNGGGMFSCKADGGDFENIDSPPSAFIVCSVDSVSSEITGLKVGDVVEVIIMFSGESPGVKDAAIQMESNCDLSRSRC